MIRKVVSSTDVRTYEEEFNRMAEELKEKSPTIKDIFENGTLTTVFTYEEEERVPECAKDEAEIAGIRYTCGDCPYLQDDGDKRKRSFPCDYSEWSRTRVDQPACDKFYRDLMRGEIKPRG